ncbi:unnamed protein product [Mytilus coruscus]|uniref:Globin domain-containing protein n=1 Tax=Mytilus coruscus TaxID=42192 RepID=A0A6J8D021_MYTCO|nr:unnamed protein product [Mytilus coruscus]
MIIPITIISNRGEMTENGTANGSDSDALLTKEEVNAIQETWALVWSDKKNNGIDFFVKFFTHFPEAQTTFLNTKKNHNARNHVDRNVGGKEVKWLVPPFVELLEEKTNGKVTELHKTAWTKVFDVIASISDEEVEKAK